MERWTGAGMCKPAACCSALHGRLPPPNHAFWEVSLAPHLRLVAHHFDLRGHTTPTKKLHITLKQLYIHLTAASVCQICKTSTDKFHLLGMRARRRTETHWD